MNNVGQKVRSFVFAFVLSSGVGCSQTAFLPSTCQLSQAPRVSAHRGDRQAGPDNSLRAIRAAVQAGIPYIEVDVRLSEDGELFLFHDRHLRSVNVIADRKWLGVRPESVPSDVRRSFLLPKHFGEDAGERTSERIPSLAEAIVAIKGSSSVLQLDLKGTRERLPDVLNRVMAVVDALGAEQQVLLQTPGLEAAAYVRSQNPTIPILFIANHPDEVAPALRFGPRIVQLNDEALCFESIKLLRGRAQSYAKGTEEDTRAYWCKLACLGIDIIMTDRPYELRDLRCSE